MVCIYLEKLITRKLEITLNCNCMNAVQTPCKMWSRICFRRMQTSNLKLFFGWFLWVRKICNIRAIPVQSDWMEKLLQTCVLSHNLCLRLVASYNSPIRPKPEVDFVVTRMDEKEMCQELG